MKKLLRRVAPILILMPGLGLGADDLKWGAQAALCAPLGDLKTALDSNIGFTVGGHLGYYLEEGHEIRPRVDYTRYEGGSFSANSLSYKNNVSAFSFGADYIYYLEQRRQGFYVTGGVGCAWWTLDGRHVDTTHTNSATFQAGGGFRFNPTTAVELVYAPSRFRSGNGEAGSLQAGLSIRF